MKNLMFLCVGLFTICQQPLVFPPIYGEILILPLEVLDGDTISFAYLIVEHRGRLHGISAPEIKISKKDPDREVKIKNGLDSKQNLQKILPNGVCKAILKGKEKYGGVLIELFTKDGKSINELQIQSGHAKPWDGKGKPPE